MSSVLITVTAGAGVTVEGKTKDDFFVGAGGRAPPRPAGTAGIGAIVHLPVTAIEEGRDPSSMTASWPTPPTVCCAPDGPASLQVSVQEPAPVLQLEPRGAGVSAQIGVQRLLLAAESVEQVQGPLPGFPSSSHCSRNSSGMVTCRASSRWARGT